MNHEPPLLRYAEFPLTRIVQAKHIDIFPDLKMAMIYEHGYPDEIFNEAEKA